MLKTNSNKGQREKYKDEAITVREAGELDRALQMFKEVVSWDEVNGTSKGKMDSLGHLRITYTRLGDQTEDKEERKQYRKLAMETSEQAIQVGEADRDIKEDTKAIQKVHSASARLDYGEFIKGDAKKELLRRALKDINDALENFPGSQAHKAWALNVKAKVQYAQGKTEDALDTLKKGELYLFEGYKDEIRNDDQAEIKLNVWLAGLHLTFASICAKEGRIILAKHYATSILNTEDKNNILGERKKEAQRILDITNNR